MGERVDERDRAQTAGGVLLAPFDQAKSDLSVQAGLDAQLAVERREPDPAGAVVVVGAVVDDGGLEHLGDEHDQSQGRLVGQVADQALGAHVGAALVQGVVQTLGVDDESGHGHLVARGHVGARLGDLGGRRRFVLFIGFDDGDREERPLRADAVAAIGKQADRPELALGVVVGAELALGGDQVGHQFQVLGEVEALGRRRRRGRPWRVPGPWRGPS
jgi:hypothetical protein